MCSPTVPVGSPTGTPSRYPGTTCERLAVPPSRRWDSPWPTRSPTAQQPRNNIIRVALQSMSAVLGGTQSLHACSYDEALGLPSEEAATLSVRTQQVIAHETNVPNVADPLGGSYLVEALTDQVESGARHLMGEVEAQGGAVG